MRLREFKEDGIMNKHWNGFLRLWWFSQVTYCTCHGSFYNFWSDTTRGEIPGRCFTCTCHGSFYNFWSDTTRGEIPGRCFQMVKQNVKHFLKSIWHLEPYVILCVAWTFCGSFIYVRLYMTDIPYRKWFIRFSVSSVKHQPEGGCSTARTERKKGRNK